MPSTDEHVEKLYAQLLRIESESEREAFLSAAKARSPEQAEQLSDLYRYGKSAQRVFGVLDENASALNETCDSNPDDPRDSRKTVGHGRLSELTSGSVIGPYKLLEPIGEGGMGVVFLAQQSSPVRRKVALKIIKPGMDSKQVIARFEAERQALAMMEHPNIARALDAGTTESGLPFFVMELVRGIPMSDYCDQSKMATRQRLELFCDACDAIQHAHNKGIIHRDIKPSNVLVTEQDGKPLVKVIDFGVAKALTDNLTDKTLFTGMFQLMGTPLYMSPEQASLSNVDVDVRSDVYSLGVMLYELLSGTLPIDRKTAKELSFEQLRLRICDTEPPRPSKRLSTLKEEQKTIAERRGVDPKHAHRIISSELDWIVMKAIEKDRKRRYQSARELGEDVRRYLSGDAVEACPPSLQYRATKYVRRNRAALATLTVVGVALLASTGVSLVFAYRTNQALEVANSESKKVAAEKEKSEENFAAALNAVDKLLAHASSQQLFELPQAQPIQKRMLEDVLEFYDRFAVSTGDSPELRFRAAKTWFNLAMLAKELDEVELSIRAFEEGTDHAQSLVDSFPRNFEFASLYVTCEVEFAYFLSRCKELERAESHFIACQQCLDTAQSGFTQQAQQWLRLRLLWCQCMAIHSTRKHDKDAEQRYAQASWDILQQLDSPTPREVAVAAKAVAISVEEEQPDLADEMYRIAVDHAIKLDRNDSSREDLTKLLYTFANAARYFEEYDPQYSIQLSQRFLELSCRLTSRYPSLDLYRKLHLMACNRVINFAKADGTAKEDKLTILKFALEHFPVGAGQDPRLLITRGSLRRECGHMDEATMDFSRSVELENDANRIQNTGLLIQRGAHWFWTLKDYKSAISDFDACLEIRPSPMIYEWRGRSHFYLSQFDQALSDWAECLRLKPEQLDDLTRVSRSEWAACSDPSFRDGVLRLVSERLDANPSDAKAHHLRAYLNDAFGRNTEALQDLGEALRLDPENTESINLRLDLLLREQRWSEAAADYELRISKGDDNFANRYRLGLLKILQDDQAGYQRVCRNLTSPTYIAGCSEDPTALHFIAWTSSLVPDGLDDYTSAIEQAKIAADRSPENQQFLCGLGAVLMRAGELEAARKSLLESLSLARNGNTSIAYAQYFLAMTDWALGKPESAKAALRNANRQAEAELKIDSPWNRRATLQLLRKEAEAMVGDDSGDPSE